MAMRVYCEGFFMKTLNFAHISDTHLACEDSSDFVKALVPSTWQNFEKCLQDLAAMPLDFVLHTGDITHEGREEDYARAKFLFEKYLPEVPVVFAMGNHDIRQNFRAAFLNQYDDNSPYSSSKTISDLQIISIDTSACKADMLGEIPSSQMDFIEENLAKNCARGTIIIMHVPPVSETPALQMQIPARFLELVAREEIIGVFAGHMHSDFACNLQQKSLFVANSLAFSIEFSEKTAKYAGFCAYNLCHISEHGISMHTKIIAPQMRILLEKGLG